MLVSVRVLLPCVLFEIICVCVCILKPARVFGGKQVGREARAQYRCHLTPNRTRTDRFETDSCFIDSTPSRFSYEAEQTSMPSRTPVNVSGIYMTLRRSETGFDNLCRYLEVRELLMVLNRFLSDHN